ncbi:MAG: NB-ARC domain-containing protein, partial [Stackebrandtia sp.]
MDVELRLGQPGRVVEEARRLLAEHPYRQNLAAMLLRGLGVSGRATEAREVFARLRTRLREDLGIDPARQLRQAHEQLSRTETDLGAPTTRPEHQPPLVPAQLPADVSGFTGREEQLTILDSMLDGPGPAVTTLKGAGGIGKTALAVRWGRSRLDRYPDGQLFANLRGYDHSAPVAAHEVLTRFLRAFGFAAAAIPADMDEAVALYRTVLNTRRVLVVLDNASSVGQVRPLLPTSSGCAAIVTSRDGMVGLTALDGARPVELGLLDETESLDLLSDLATRARLDAEPQAAAEVVRLCGRLPLALRVVGANLAARPRDRLADVVSELEGADRLERLAVLGDSRATVADSINLSVSGLDTRIRRFFLHLGLIPGTEIATGLAAAVTGMDAAAARTALNRLATAHLIEQPRPDGWRFHDLVRLFAHSRATCELDPLDREPATQRLLDWSVDVHNQVSHGDMVATVTVLAGHPQVWKAAQGLEASIHGGHEPGEIRRVVRLALPSAVKSGDDAGQSILHNLVAGTYWASRRMPEAMAACELAVSSARHSGDPILIARHLSNMATFEALRGENGRSKLIMDEALAVSEATGDVWAISSRLDNLGELCGYLGQYADAERYLLRSLDLRPWDPQRPWPKTKAKLASVYLDSGRYAEGMRYAEETVATAPDWFREPALRLRGSLHLAMGDLDAAHADMTAGFDPDRANRFLGEKAELLAPLALCLSERGDQHAALAYARECLESGSAGGVRRDEAAACLLLATIHTRLDEFATAVDFGHRARDHYEYMTEPLRLGRCHRALSQACAGTGDAEAAAGHRREALAVFTRLGVAEFEDWPCGDDLSG